MTRLLCAATGAVRRVAMAQAVRQEGRERVAWRAAIEGAASREEIAATVSRAARAAAAWRAETVAVVPRGAIQAAVPPQAIVKMMGEMVRLARWLGREIAQTEMGYRRVRSWTVRRRIDGGSMGEALSRGGAVR